MRYLFCLLFLATPLFGQDYFTERYQPFSANISAPKDFLEYEIGSQHTRHDQIISYLQYLASVSDHAQIMYYGKTHEGRKLPLLMISTTKNLNQIETIQKAHLDYAQGRSVEEPKVPLIINLAYNVHGNEPSSSEAALLAAYTLTASQDRQIASFRENAIIFIDPTINPDGRDRHTQWANMYKGTPLVSDPMDAEHNEVWPGGRTNHYWFDLNRDWLLAINPESQGKLAWYHQWYPNVVTDFHEMGTQSTYFFEPMKPNGSLDPIMPEDNYVKLNNLFATYFSKGLDSIGSLYFTKEAFDGTYPGYGSSYPDLQGGLGLLFEQASSRGLKQKTKYGYITFPFTIRNQFISSLATVQAAVENKSLLRKYQQDFFKSAIERSAKSKIKAYDFSERDQNRNKAFIDKLLRHKIHLVKTGEHAYSVPVQQPQYRMVQTFFETYASYRDSVYYDASAWSVANFYNIKYSTSAKVKEGTTITSTDALIELEPLTLSSYAYAIDAKDYNLPAFIHDAQQHKIVLAAAFKPFMAKNNRSFSYGSLMIPVASQTLSEKELYTRLQKLQDQHNIQIHSLSTGFSTKGVDLGSSAIRPLDPPKAVMLIGNGVRSYEAGEVWHLLDTRVGMPITKVRQNYFDRLSLGKYNTMILVSGSYKWDEKTTKRVKDWIAKGNTLISIGTANNALIKHKIINEKRLIIQKDSTAIATIRPYVDAAENIGREKLGGVFLRGNIDLTHPIGFGYTQKNVSLYKNNLVWLEPSKSSYGTPVVYDKNPHVDGYISKNIRNKYLPKAAPVIVSKIGKGRVILFAENPNFRGTAYGTNRMFLNALFLGNHIKVPKEQEAAFENEFDH
ncbi:MAG: M14 family metallopeptidase [Flavobacteriaceae bacterium]|nr:M14 family metallopeptidase [Flavobacteriaceae bacterium]